MSDITLNKGAPTRFRSATEENPATRWTLIAVAFAGCVLSVLLGSSLCIAGIDLLLLVFSKLFAIVGWLYQPCWLTGMTI